MDPLRRHVVWSSNQGVSRSSLGAEKPSETEVSQLHHSRPGYEHVRWLNVSVHDPLGVHVVEGGAELHKVLPHSPLRDKLLVALEVFDHAAEVPGVGELEDDVELVVLDEGGQVCDHVRVVQLLQQLNLLHAVEPG